MAVIEQKISVADIRVGMYVSRLDRPWLETRYLFQGFHVNSLEDIEELREHCEYVYVDPERGESAPGVLQTLERSEPYDRHAAVFKNVTGHDRYPVVTTVKEEIDTCQN